MSKQRRILSRFCWSVDA